MIVLAVLGGACGSDESSNGASGGTAGSAGSSGGSGGAAASGGAGGASGSGGTGATGGTAGGAGSGGTAGSGGAPVTPTPFATYLGGNAYDSARDVAVDGQGNVVVVGGTDGSDLATAGSYDDSFNGGSSDVMITRFSSDGQRLWSTFFGGPGHDRAYAVEVDATGIYVAGRAGDGLPTTGGVVQPSFAGDQNVNPAYGPQDGFIAKLSLDGTSLIWATYLGGPGREIIRDLAIDPQGRPYAAFIEVYQTVPFITNAFDATWAGGGEGLLARLDKDATSVEYATYVGGGASEEGAASVRVDANSNAHYLISTLSDDAPVTAGAAQTTRNGMTDILLVKLDPSGAQLWGTYLGGSNHEGGETHNLALAPNGTVIVASETQSSDFPTTAGVLMTAGGAGSSFVARVSADGATLLAATTFRGPGGYTAVQGVDVDAQGRVLITGGAASNQLPVSSGAYQTTRGAGDEGFLFLLAPGLDQVVYGTWFGGGGNDSLRGAAVGPGGALVGVGDTVSTDLPTTPGAFQSTRNGQSDAMVLQVVVP